MANSVASSTVLYQPGSPIGTDIMTAVCTVSAASVAWMVCPYNAYIQGYWTQFAVSAAASTPSNFCAIYTGSSASGGLIANLSITTACTAGGPGDTYAWTAATPSTVIAGGQPISLNFNTTVLGTAYTQQVTVVFTKAGL